MTTTHCTGCGTPSVTRDTCPWCLPQQGAFMTTPTSDPVTDVWELLWTAACDYRDAAGPDRSEARLVDALMPIVTAYGRAIGDAAAIHALDQRERAARAFRDGAS